MRNPIQVGERVYLRAFELEDAEPLARMDAAEEDTFMYRGRSPRSPFTNEYSISELYTKEPPGEIGFAVCMRENGLLVGVVELHGVDYIDRTAELSTFMMVGYRNRGYGPEAQHLILEYAFDRLQLHVISGYIMETNPRSIVAAMKLGFRPAGRLKWHEVKDGIYQDMLVFDLLRDEWRIAHEAWKT